MRQNQDCCAGRSHRGWKLAGGLLLAAAALLAALLLRDRWNGGNTYGTEY